MQEGNFFKSTFDDLATEGCIGDPRGQLAYAYLRVSSSGQAEEGRSGLPRQILHVHEMALKHGFRIPWEMVFADDHTGFAFEDRPALKRLRHEYTSPNRRAHTLVIENLDRLSRNADWHQGYLLDEMKQHGLGVLFWKSFSSRIERAVIGAISQEGMEQALERMRHGNLMKAQDGRVTARTRAYGYQFVDSEGQPSPRSRKDTHYAPHPEEAEVIRLIFEKIALEGVSTRSLATYLESRFPPPGKYRHWEARQIVLFVRNPVYKGEFIANRFQEVQIPARKQRPLSQTKLVKKKVLRPQEDWITVPVPALVTPELWELANRAIDKNAQMSRRNSNEPFLLTGLVTCATCGYSYIGGRKRYQLKHGQTISTFYRCAAKHIRQPAVAKEINCNQSQINCQILDDAVWGCLCQLLLDPQMLLSTLDDQTHKLTHEDPQSQIRFTQKQLASLTVEDDKLYRAYIAGVFDEHEFGQRRQTLKDRKAILAKELVRLQEQQESWQQLNTKREMVLSLAHQARLLGLAMDAPFAVKQQVIKLMVDRIELNIREQWFRIEGVIPGLFTFEQQDEFLRIESIPAGRDSWRQQAETPPAGLTSHWRG